MKRVLLILSAVLIAASNSGFAAFEFKEAGPRAVGLSGAYTSLAKDAYAPFWNPAALGEITAREAVTFYSQMHSMASLSRSGAAYAQKTRAGTMALGFSQFGTGTYREQEIIFSHGFIISSKLNAGYSLKNLLLKIDGFGSASKFAFDLGFQSGLTERLDVSLSGRNLNRPAFGAQKEPLPSVWTSGFAFKVMPGLLLACDLEGLGSSPKFKTGLELELSPTFAVRGGLANGPTRFSGGFRASHGRLSLDYAYQHHAFLAGSHHMGISFSWGSPEPTPGLLNEESEMKPARKIRTKIFKFDQKINLLTATSEDLLRIPGIGKFTAENLIAYRDQVGIKTIEDVLYIPGMTKRVFLTIKDTCVVEAP